ncbi:hypothetical protein CPB86DRAFT_54898 [Serendipita vermifera]|nr:hypothetical protein CPB86DRAFT_54898 [Serendipita vermifera]
MSIVLFQDTAVELAAQGDIFLTDIAHLILEVNLNGEIVEKVNLLSREASPGTWVCVVMELGGNDRQLLGSIELSGLQLFDAPGEPFEMEMPFMCHESYPNLTLKTRALATTMETFREVASQHAQRSMMPQLAHNLQVLNDRGVEQLDDFERHRNPQSLEQAISNLQQAAEICPKYHPGLPSILTNLSAVLFRRFERLGSLADIHEAIERQQAAVNLTPDEDDKKSERLCNLGNSFSIRFIRLGDLTDLENAFVQHQAAVDLTPDQHKNKPHYLSSLGGTYGTRFERLGHLEDMDHAITYQQMAVNLAPDSDPGKHMVKRPSSLCQKVTCMNTFM